MRKAIAENVDGFPAKGPKAIPEANDKRLTLKESMAEWTKTGPGQKNPLNETTSKEYAAKAFVDNKIRSSMQGMFKEENWVFEPNGMLRAEMKSNSGGAPYKLSLFPFALPDVLDKIEKGDTDYSALATQVVRGDIAPFCSCPNFIYQNAGPRGAGKQLLNPGSDPSKKSNWGLCKHLYFPVEMFPFVQKQIAKRLKDGFFNKELVSKQANDGRTRAFLNEGWVIVEADGMIKAAIDNEALYEKLDNDEVAGKIFDAVIESVSKACPDYDIPQKMLEKINGFSLKIAEEASGDVNEDGKKAADAKSVNEGKSGEDRKNQPESSFTDHNDKHWKVGKGRFGVNATGAFVFT